MDLIEKKLISIIVEEKRGVTGVAIQRDSIILSKDSGKSKM